MSFNEVKDLRHSGKLKEAYDKAKEELEKNPNDIWNKRSIAWVLYEFIKSNAASSDFTVLEERVKELIQLSLPDDEKMVFDSVGWQIVKIGYDTLKKDPVDLALLNSLFELIKQLKFTKPSDVYSALFKMFNKIHDVWPKYLEFVQWWDFDNFRSEDYLKEKLPDGKEIISLAERGYIAVSKRLLDDVTKTMHGTDLSLQRQRLKDFLPKLEKLIENHPEYQYPPYFKAKILLALGDMENVLSVFLPFARSKASEFWVWDLLSEIFDSEPDKKIACLCKALLCKTPPEFFIKVRSKLAEILITKSLFSEAKTEILEILKIRQNNKWPIPHIVAQWISAEWYLQATERNSNIEFYKLYFAKAEEILFQDFPEELAVVEFVNQDKKVLSFIINKEKTGFFRYDRYLKKVEVGDRLLVRLEGTGTDTHYRVISMKTTNEQPGIDVMKSFKGELRIKEGQFFGFVELIFVAPELIKKDNLKNGQIIKGEALVSFNKKKGEWGWKAINTINIASSQE